VTRVWAPSRATLSRHRRPGLRRRARSGRCPMQRRARRSVSCWPAAGAWLPAPNLVVGAERRAGRGLPEDWAAIALRRYPLPRRRVLRLMPDPTCWRQAGSADRATRSPRRHDRTRAWTRSRAQPAALAPRVGTIRTRAWTRCGATDLGSTPGRRGLGVDPRHCGSCLDRMHGHPRGAPRHAPGGTRAAPPGGAGSSPGISGRSTPAGSRLRAEHDQRTERALRPGRAGGRRSGGPAGRRPRPVSPARARPDERTPCNRESAADPTTGARAINGRHVIGRAKSSPSRAPGADHHRRSRGSCDLQLAETSPCA
jgi:hypothetical protein